MGFKHLSIGPKGIEHLPGEGGIIILMNIENSHISNFEIQFNAKKNMGNGSNLLSKKCMSKAVILKRHISE